MNNGTYTVQLIQTIGLIIYKYLSLIVGLATIYMGYKLFIKGFLSESAEMEGAIGDYKIALRKAAPGTFFALFGTIVIAYCIFKGLEFDMSNKNFPFPDKKESQALTVDSTKGKDTTIKLPSEPPK